MSGKARHILPRVGEVELPHAKIDQTESRGQGCVDENARLRRVEGKSKNHSFENALKPDLN
jgi:hypothetical protein